MAELIVHLLLRMQMAASVAVLIVLLMRPLGRRLLGPEIAYRLWVVAPLAALLSLFPSPRDALDWREVGGLSASAPDVGMLLGVYLAGAAATLAFFVASEWRFRRLARLGRVGPALVGLAWPRLVLPADYGERFNAAEQRLIRAHERTHIACEHPRDNRLIAVMQVLGWFNPLMHVAAASARFDQELACDAIVTDRAGVCRRTYAQAMLKAQRSTPWSAFACGLVGRRSHPLEIRIRHLSRTRLSLRQQIWRDACAAGLSAAVAAGLWGVAPGAYDTFAAERDQGAVHAKVVLLDLTP